MEKLVWCLAVVVAVSGCVTPSGRYAALKEESLKARTLEEAVKASAPSKASVGQEIKLNLEKSDDILLTSDGDSPDLYYVSYYRLYSFEVIAGQHYTLTVKSFCDCLGFQKLFAVPAAYVVDGEGRPVSRVLHPVQQVMGDPDYSQVGTAELIGNWEFTAEKNGQYLLVLAANNSDPGQLVGEVYLKDKKLTFSLQSSTTGSMTFQIRAF